jgi:glycerate kinase
VSASVALGRTGHLSDPASVCMPGLAVGFRSAIVAGTAIVTDVRILVAFDKFKDSLTAAQACGIAAREIRERHADWEIDAAPLTDGGDGFAELLTTQAHGDRVPVRATGPRGATIDAIIGSIPWRHVQPAARTLLALPAIRDGETIAVVEMATASGLALLRADERNPWQTSTFGTGQLIRAAAELGARAVVLGVGGSATNDLGLGALAALGFESHDAAGARIHPPIPASWSRLARIDGRMLDSIPRIRIACDVANPLLGPTGAAAVFGPQKGLAPADVPRVDAEAGRIARMLCVHCGTAPTCVETPGAGAAGGLAFGLLAAGRAQLVRGFDLVRAWLDLDARIAQADFVLTGEGRFDLTSLGGKGPGALALAAAVAGKRVLVLTGNVGELPPGALPQNVAVHAITPAGMPLEQALREAPERLAAAVRTMLAVIEEPVD